MFAWIVTSVVQFPPPGIGVIDVRVPLRSGARQHLSVADAPRDRLLGDPLPTNCYRGDRLPIRGGVPPDGRQEAPGLEVGTRNADRLTDRRRDGFVSHRFGHATRFRSRVVDEERHVHEFPVEFRVVGKVAVILELLAVVARKDGRRRVRQPGVVESSQEPADAGVHLVHCPQVEGA